MGDDTAHPISSKQFVPETKSFPTPGPPPCDTGGGFLPADFGYCPPSISDCNFGGDPGYGPAYTVDGVQADRATANAVLASGLGLYITTTRKMPLALISGWLRPHESDCGIYYYFGPIFLLYGVSAEGGDFIKGWEKWRNHLYDDLGPGKGNCTVGFGHLVHRGPCDGRASESPYANGISPEDGETLFKKDLLIALKAVASSNPWGISFAQMDMLVDFVFNAGSGNYSGRSGLADMVGAQNWELVPSTIMGGPHMAVINGGATKKRRFSIGGTHDC